MERSSVCRCAGETELWSAFFDHLPEGLLKVVERNIASGAPGVDDDVPLRPDFRAMNSKQLAYPAFDAVADH
jgi:hypothetical protein